MNNTSELNSELLCEDARSRKHIPVAVFAVIMIHVVLFVLLLIAAGCRSTARAKATQPQPGEEQRVHPTQQYMQAGNEPTSGAGITLPPIDPVAEATAAAVAAVVATEPQLDDEPVNALAARQTQQAPPQATANREEPALPASVERAQRSTANASQQPTIYVVQSGDTVDKIAKQHGTTIEAVKAANKLKNHLIYPGQKLLIKPRSGAASTAQLKSRKSPKGEA